jgi:hypothetical protein
MTSAPSARRASARSSSWYSTRWIPYRSAAGNHRRPGSCHWFFGRSSSFQRRPASHVANVESAAPDHSEIWPMGIS